MTPPAGSTEGSPSTPRPDRRSVLAAGAGLAAGATLVGCASAPEPERRERLDEAFSELDDHSGDVAPIDATERRARRGRLGALLAARGLDALLCEAGATMTYLAGVSWGRSERLFALVVQADGSAFLVCPAFEEDRARQRARAAGLGDVDIVTWQEHEYPYRPLAAELERRRARRVAVDPQLRVVFAQGLAAAHTPPESGADVVAALRGAKDAHELALLRRANELTQTALVAVSERLEPGMSGGDVSALVHAAQRRLGLVSTWDLSLIGPASAFPHGVEGETRLARGDVLLIDTGGSLHGYQSDNTRTWVFGAPPDAEVRRVWQAVRDAQRRAFETIRPGVECRAVDRAARESLERAGYGPGYRYLTHRLGHGIGLEGHEDPYFDGGSTVRLVEGMTLSDEPGVYQVGRFGLRIEDIVCVTADGADHFGTWQRGPEGPA